MHHQCAELAGEACFRRPDPDLGAMVAHRHDARARARIQCRKCLHKVLLTISAEQLGEKRLTMDGAKVVKIRGFTIQG